MATNGTSVLDLGATTTPNQASGRSIFWAIASIALNAMLQPSFTGYLWSGDTFKDSLWPHRSSPFICLMDAAADVWIMVEKFRKPELYNKTEEKIQPTTLTMRLAIFVIGVLPQVIKLFGSTGIPITQAVAAVFVFATMTSMVRTTCSPAPMSDVICLAERALWKKPAEEKGPDDNDAPSYGVIICLAGTLIHVLALTCIWEHIFRVTHIRTSSTDADNLLEWIFGLATLACGIYLLQHTACVLVTGRWYIPRSAPLLLFGLYTPLLLNRLLEDPSSCRRQARCGGTDYWMLISSFLCHGGVLAYVVALVLEVSARRLLRFGTKDNSVDSALPTTEPTDDQRSFDTQTGPGTVSGRQTPVGEPVAPSPDAPIQAGASLSSTLAIPGTANVSGPHGSGPAADQEENVIIAQPSADSSSDSALRPTEKKPSYLAEAVCNLLFCIVAVPLGLYVFISFYNDGSPRSETDAETADATERGEATGSEAEPASTVDSHEKPEPWSLMLFLLLIAIQPIVLLYKLPCQDKVIRPVVKVISLGVWRLYISGMSTYGFALNWLAAKIRIHIKDRVCVAFGILNFATAMITYLAVFDAQGTYAPSWTSLLGK